MTFWIFAVITLIGAIHAAFSGKIRNAVLALWMTGIGAGGIYLSLGAELLAVVQWIISTLIATSFYLYAVMFGENEWDRSGLSARDWVIGILGILVCVAFIGMIDHGAGELSVFRGGVPMNVYEVGIHLTDIGRNLIEDHWVAVGVTGLMLLLVIIGSAVIGRSEEGSQ